jgi:hypothetical protein
MFRVKKYLAVTVIAGWVVLGVPGAAPGQWPAPGLSLSGGLHPLLAGSPMPQRKAGQPPKTQNKIGNLGGGIRVLGVKVSASTNPPGLRVTGFLPDGPNPLGDDSTLDVGDVILRIGNSPALIPNRNPNDLIDRAYNSGNAFIVVRDVNGGGTFRIPLP